MNNICESCFEDKELKGFILSEGEIKLCDFCSCSNNKVIAIEELLDFFDELLGNFESHSEGSGVSSLISLIQGDWNLFRNNGTGSKFLNIIINRLALPFFNADVPVQYSQEILSNVNYWFKLKEQLKWERRYLIDINYLTDELGWDGFFESKFAVGKNDILYRARLHQNTNDEKFSPEKMFCPPRELSTAGRANPMGIPYLYLSDKQETILYEIRSAYLDEVSIGKFSVKKSLTEDVLISDFTEKPTIYHPTEVNKKIKSKLLKEYISRDLSQPLRRYDSELDYIPTQFICEFIKTFTGVKGLKFTSSLHNVGNNYVIFNQDIFECIEVNKINISKVEISYN
ncbi:RES family NAD+ phosphorylase [Psychrobacter cryohalolentis]|uniref:RES family NAD+ phosphorylase n=1 Tax=Psychrobacter cryohalolentis TaxID=330922 RepID=UPI003F827E1A